MHSTRLQQGVHGADKAADKDPAQDREEICSQRQQERVSAVSDRLSVDQKFDQDDPGFQNSLENRKAIDPYIDPADQDCQDIWRIGQDIGKEDHGKV